jgi:type II secretory pathway pseudopilin PulG
MTIKRHRGFTLIEALVYLALFTILMGGAVAAAYNIFEAAERGGTRTMLQEETDFLIAKVNWALSGAEAVTAPGTGTTGGALTVVKWDTSIGNPVVITRNGTNLTMTKAGGSEIILNNTNVEVRDIQFTHTEGSGDGVNPESVTAVLLLSARTDTGAVLLRQATTTVYLRQ